MNRAFTPSKVASWEPQVRELAEEQVDRLRELREVDFVRAAANPLLLVTARPPSGRRKAGSLPSRPAPAR